ncbi:MAG: hypothetical protein HKN87_13420 [Saprospiraceae bacterium]|nr:hypothetical protein [Saprospiraceae bacterium]
MSGKGAQISWVCAYFILLGCCHLPIGLHGQGHYWWADNVEWDGVTHWSEYIVYGPNFLGPNAMPVPSFSTGKIEKNHAFTAGIQGHFNKGDQTQNLRIEGTYVMLKDKVSFDFDWVPLEFFQVSHEMKTRRRTFHTFYDASKATGDFYVNTNIQVLRRKGFALAARLGYKFPISNMQGAARFTDSPGYYANVSSFVNLQPSNETNGFGLVGMLGFYAWQTNLDEQFQNDALLAGIGLRHEGIHWDFEGHLRGYWGYLNIGDQPVVAEIQMDYKMKKIGVSLALTRGLQDFPFTSLMLSATHFMAPRQ